MEKRVECEFDKVFPPSSTQSDVYEVLKDCAESVVSGFNSTVFAYGQTGSGKTFTTLGPDSDSCLFEPGPVHELAGIIPRAVRDVFKWIHKSSDRSCYSVFCSYIQACVFISCGKVFVLQHIHIDL